MAEVDEMTIEKNVGDFIGTSLQGHLETPWSFEESVARLIGCGFMMENMEDGYKVSVQFVGTFNGRVFTLYDYKEGRNLHVGGMHQLPVALLMAELIALMTDATPVPYQADEHYGRKQGHGWPRRER